MTVKARTPFVAIPLAAILTAAATVVIFETPWNALPGVFGGMVTTGSGPLVALGRIATTPETPSVDETPGPVLDTVAVVELPLPAVEVETVAEDPRPTLPGREPNEPIDYARLNTDVHTVTDTLERFNQKLLRMIAQAKAAQTGNPVPQAVDAETAVALDAPVTPETPAEPAGELTQ